MALQTQSHFRNVAIVAHVDHGKTTLIDAMLKFSKIFRENQQVNELIMDSNPQERERGITILAKNTAIKYKDVTLNIIDTPGHVDFSGEVERVVNMADGCILVVDAVDGPMPQTKYVLKVAMESGLKPLVVINKIDRSKDEIETTVDAINDLFLELATDADQLDFPILFASAKEGYAINELYDEPVDMTPLFDSILEYIPPPIADADGGFQMLVAALDYDNHIGQIAIGRIFRGNINKNEPLVFISEDGSHIPFRAEHLFSFKDLSRYEVDDARSGDIVAVSGATNISIGDTITSKENPESLGRISIEEPTVMMTFGVNTSPFSGKDGKYATSRDLWARLQKELQTNVSMRVERTDSAEEFKVSGRGELHLSVLIEDIRREGLEFQVSKPEAIIRMIEGSPYEPYEKITIDCPSEFVGVITEELSSRLGQMKDMQADDNNNMRIIYSVPTRGLIGFRGFIAKATKGNAIMNTELEEHQIMKGNVKPKRAGAIVASESGVAVSYGIKNAQERGQTFIPPNTQVYGGMIVGTHNRDMDLPLNICKERKVTNMRSSTSEIVERLEPPIKLSLEESLEFIAEDEIAEITPNVIRMRKRVLDINERHRLLRPRFQHK